MPSTILGQGFPIRLWQSLRKPKCYKLGNDANGVPLATTASFLSYITSKAPQFHDGLRSSYCWEALVSSYLENFCTDSLGTYYSPRSARYMIFLVLHWR